MNLKSEILLEARYVETVEYLYNQLPVYQNIGSGAYKEGLDNSLALDKYFKHPHRKYKAIHIAGTNGKGSTSHLLAAILQQSGYKVGLYTSPHLVDFRERIRVDGEKIDKEYVVNFVETHKQAFEPIHPSFFELTMMIAFQYFADMNVDIAIVETGLGGRLDSTNIITPDVCVITNISLDHVQFLGNSLEAIASEKAGIIKRGIPVVIGEAVGDVKVVFEKSAKEVSAPIVFAEEENLLLSYVRDSGFWVYQTSQYPNLRGQLSGYAQLKNVSTVLCTVRILLQEGYTIPADAVYSGFANVCELTGLLGRWQIVADRPKTICDTGHNVAGIQLIVEQLSHETYKLLHIVLGVVNDKDVTSILKLLPKDAIYYFTNASINRALPAEELASQASLFCLKGNIYASVVDAILAAQNAAHPDDFIFIGGSNFVVGEALPIL